MKMKLFITVALLSASSLPVFANNQTRDEIKPTVDSIPADPKDVNNPEAVVNAMYSVISGSAGQKRNWDRMRTLYLPEAKMIAIGRKKPDGSVGRRVITVEDYIKLTEPLFDKDAFVEKQISVKKEEFGNLVHIFSTYESSLTKDGTTTVERGINSFQLCFDGKRWWIVNVIWQNETSEFPLPGRYLQ